MNKKVFLELISEEVLPCSETKIIEYNRSIISCFSDGATKFVLNPISVHISINSLGNQRNASFESILIYSMVSLAYFNSFQMRIIFFS